LDEINPKMSFKLESSLTLQVSFVVVKLDPTHVYQKSIWSHLVRLSLKVSRDASLTLQLILYGLS